MAAFNDLVIDGDYARDLGELGLAGDEDGANMQQDNDWAAFLDDHAEEREGSPEDMADVGPVGDNPLRDEVDALAAQVKETTETEVQEEVRRAEADKEPQKPNEFYSGFNSIDQLDAETRQRVEEERRRQGLKDTDSSAAYRSTLAPIAELQEEGKKPPYGSSSNFDSMHVLGDEAAKLKSMLSLSPDRKGSLGGPLARPPLSPDPKTSKFGQLNKSDLMPQFQLSMHQTLAPGENVGLLTPGVKKKKTFTRSRIFGANNNLVLDRIDDVQEQERGVTP